MDARPSPVCHVRPGALGMVRRWGRRARTESGGSTVSGLWD